MASLIDKSCVPCRGGIPPMAHIEAETMLKQVPGWSLEDNATRLQRRFKHPNFATALDFVQRVAALAEAQDHHPDVCFGWGYATISLYTHKIGGLHDNDFIMAAKINALL